MLHPKKKNMIHSLRFLKNTIVFYQQARIAKFLLKHL